MRQKKFRNFFEVSGKSHSAEKFKRGDALGFLNIHSVAKYQKLMGGTIKNIGAKEFAHGFERQVPQP